jgi:hypothetical protein
LFAGDYRRDTAPAETHRTYQRLLFSLNNKALLVCIMAFTFLTVERHSRWGPWSAGSVLQTIPDRHRLRPVGFVEGVLPFALNMLRVQWDAAVLITDLSSGNILVSLIVGIATFRILSNIKSACR